MPLNWRTTTQCERPFDNCTNSPQTSLEWYALFNISFIENIWNGIRILNKIMQIARVGFKIQPLLKGKILSSIKVLVSFQKNGLKFGNFKNYLKFFQQNINLGESWAHKVIWYIIEGDVFKKKKDVYFVSLSKKLYVDNIIILNAWSFILYELFLPLS